MLCLAGDKREDKWGRPGAGGDYRPEYAARLTTVHLPAWDGVWPAGIVYIGDPERPTTAQNSQCRQGCRRARAHLNREECRETGRCAPGNLSQCRTNHITTVLMG